MIKKYFSFLFYIIAALFIGAYVASEQSNSFSLSEFGRLFLLCGSCLFMYFGGLLLSKYKNNNKPMKINLWIFFILYIILLLTLTLFDPMWGRHGFSFFKLSFSNIMKSVNLVPFKTIGLYISQFDSMYSTRQVILNLLGNFCALMPMAFFLPLLFKKENKFCNYFITIVLIVLGIELAQLLSSSGQFDIDDFILNTTGAIVMYFILKTKTMNSLISNIFLLEKNKITKKDFMKVLLIVIIILIFAFGLIKFRNRLYTKNYEEFNKLHNPTILIVDESDTCQEALEEFYEDDLYKYYFPCIKSNQVYAVINEEEKFLVKDIVEGKTRYNIDINRMLERLDYYEVSYIKENKYEYIPFNVMIPINPSGGYSSPNVNISIEDENILNAKLDYLNSNLGDNHYVIDLHLIPIKEGTTNINILFTDSDNSVLESYRYSITVDEKLDIKYENKE